MAEIIPTIPHPAPPRFVIESHGPSYAVECLPSADARAALLEKLWHKHYGDTVFPRLMQQLGDFGRKYFPMLARVRMRGTQYVPFGKD